MSWENEANQSWAQQQIAQSIDAHGNDVVQSLAAIQNDVAEVKKHGTRNTIFGSIIGTFIGVLAGYFSIVIIELLKRAH